MKSYVKWVGDQGSTDFPEFSICMRCIRNFDARLLEYLYLLRYTPFRIRTDSHSFRYETILASVINNEGTNDKDSVV